METAKDVDIPEMVLTEILARLPLRSISRFRSVCKTWKSILESVYFRWLFVSLHKNSRCCWSLPLPLKQDEPLINFHGCETWDLPKSLASYLGSVKTGTFSYSDGLILIPGVGVEKYSCYVGNPVLGQWFVIPPPPPQNGYCSRLFLLFTRVDEDGVVLSFKVVWFFRSESSRSDDMSLSSSFCLFVYSSDTGLWTPKKLHCPFSLTSYHHPMSLNGKLYMPILTKEVILAHDVYGETNLLQVIPLPDQDQDLSHNKLFKRALTSSNRFVVYIKTLGDSVLKVWRLINDECWQLMWELRFPVDHITYYAPVAMHPFHNNIVYLWSQQKGYLVSCNLQTQNYKILVDESYWYNDDDGHQDCFVNQSICEKHMNLKCNTDFRVSLFHFVLPRWVESMPQPPQVEMMDTTSLLSYMASMQKEVPNVSENGRN